MALLGMGGGGGTSRGFSSGGKTYFMEDSSVDGPCHLQRSASFHLCLFRSSTQAPAAPDAFRLSFA